MIVLNRPTIDNTTEEVGSVEEAIETGEEAYAEEANYAKEVATNEEELTKPINNKPKPKPIVKEAIEATAEEAKLGEEEIAEEAGDEAIEAGSETSPIEEEPTYSIQPTPSNGEVQLYTDEPRVAPFQIQTSGNGYYLVKLVKAYSNDTVMEIFVHGGQSVSVEVPLGDYEVRYAFGQDWYGYDYLFGEDTTYSKADKILNFQNNGYQVSGYTIVLYKVANGNLHTSRISALEF